MLESSIDKALAGRTGVRFFFPLCGKAVDMKCSIDGQFGAIWDRRSLVAINPRDRENYATLIISLMAKDCRYLLGTLLYNPELLKGNNCDIELLQSVDALTDKEQGWGLDYLAENVHLITLKSS